MKRTVFQIVHAVIILNLLVQMVYAGTMVFSVWRPEGVVGPLWEAGKSVPFEFMVTRRLYAIEFWIATVGLSVYLALTEIGPRLRLEQK